MSHPEDVEPEENSEEIDEQQAEKPNDHQGVYEAARRYAESWVPPDIARSEPQFFCHDLLGSLLRPGDCT